jgi:hypothetical protein
MPQTFHSSPKLALELVLHSDTMLQAIFLLIAIIIILHSVYADGPWDLSSFNAYKNQRDCAKWCFFIPQSTSYITNYINLCCYRSDLQDIVIASLSTYVISKCTSNIQDVV